MSDNERVIDHDVLLSRQEEMVSGRMGEISVAIVGMGAIGSNAFSTLARTGVTRFTVYDGDDVEPENVFPGEFSMVDVGKPKTEAMAERVQRDLGIPLQVETRGWFRPEDEHEPHNVWLVCTDNMDSRRAVWEVVRERRLADLYLDARMGGAGYELYTVDQTDVEWVFSFSTEHLELIQDNDLPCGQKSTAFITRMIGGDVTQSVRAYANNDLDTVPNMLLVDVDAQLRATM